MTGSSLADRFKALVLVLLAIFIMQKLISGDLFFYIGRRFAWLALVAVVLLIALASSYNLVSGERTGSEDGHSIEEGAGHTHTRHGGQRIVWSIVFVALPTILGVVVPAQPLGAGAVESRGVNTGLALSDQDVVTSLTTLPGERSVLDWVSAMSSNPDPAALDGQQADVVGFVYRDARFAQGQFMVGRFTLTCCVADALAIGVVVQSPEADRLALDSWVQVRGTFGAGALDGDPLPVLFAEELIPVEPPDQPYLYP